MQDGRIETQGTLKELRATGQLEEIVQATKTEAKKDDPVASTEEVTDVAVDAKPAADGAKKKPSKLVEDEHREEGGVKWSVYNTYIRAS
jgi:hypothetical protein